MRKIGLIGGLSSESTASYYAILNGLARDALGASHSARILLSSVDFAEAEERRIHYGANSLGGFLAAEARILETGGAEILAICSNTMHLAYEAVTAEVSVPVIHIADCIGQHTAIRPTSRVGFLGTGSAVRNPSYVARIEKHGVKLALPTREQQAEIDELIYARLCQAIIRQADKVTLLSIVSDLVAQGCAAIVNGCTELSLILGQSDLDVPLVDSTYQHCAALASFSFPKK